ncbi:unnamed protein product [Orchesella dallaii]|uniref:Mucin-2-like n=1 Tax=Orchesella dallaii TaxID=48710 RepID=A0ABP1RPJ1_9HEXA
MESKTLKKFKVVYVTEFIKKYKCKIYKKTSKQKANIIQHYDEAHLREKPFLCDVCAKTVARKIPSYKTHDADVIGHNDAAPVILTVHKKQCYVISAMIINPIDATAESSWQKSAEGRQNLIVDYSTGKKAQFTTENPTDVPNQQDSDEAKNFSNTFTPVSVVSSTTPRTTTNSTTWKATYTPNVSRVTPTPISQSDSRMQIGSSSLPILLLVFIPTLSVPSNTKTTTAKPIQVFNNTSQHPVTQLPTISTITNNTGITIFQKSTPRANTPKAHIPYPLRNNSIPLPTLPGNITLIQRVTPTLTTTSTTPTSTTTIRTTTTSPKPIILSTSRNPVTEPTLNSFQFPSVHILSSPSTVTTTSKLPAHYTPIPIKTTAVPTTKYTQKPTTQAAKIVTPVPMLNFYKFKYSAKFRRVYNYTRDSTVPIIRPRTDYSFVVINETKNENYNPFGAYCHPSHPVSE